MADAYDMGYRMAMKDVDAFLEGLIDSDGLDYVIERLEEICYGKSAHLASEWQDKGAAARWRRAGGLLTDCREDMEKLDIPYPA